MIVVVLYCFTINNWKVRLTRQLERVYKSGLYDKAEAFYLYTSDPARNSLDELNNLVEKFPKVKLEYTTDNHGEAYLALSKVDELARNGNYKILYFHTKGVWNKFKNYQTRELDELKTGGVNTWVDILEYHLIDNWEKCVDKLDTFDTVGVTNYGNWWWGNFWWANSSHIRNNIPFKNFYNGRWSAEAWLHTANKAPDEIKYYEFFHFNFDPLYSILPKYLYDGTDLSSIKFEIKEANYGYFASQRDEGNTLRSEEDVYINVTEKLKLLLAEKQNNKSFYFNISDLKIEDFALELPKALRVKFTTSIDPENEYIATSFFKMPYVSILPI